MLRFPRSNLDSIDEENSLPLMGHGRNFCAWYFSSQKYTGPNDG